MSLDKKNYDKKDVIEAEKSVIASFLYYYKNVIEIIDIEEISKDIFFTEEASLIFKSLLTTEINDGKFDLVLIRDEIKTFTSDEKKIQKCEEYLLQLTKEVQYFNVEKHINILNEHYIKSELDTLSNHILKTQLSSKNFNDVIQQWENKFIETTVKNKTRNFITAEEAIKKYEQNLIEESRNEKTYLKTGFSNLDKKIKGFKPGQFVVIASRPGVGKTTFSLNLINNCLKNIEKSDKKKQSAIGIFSLEMSNDSLIEKLIAINSKICLKVLHNIREGKSVENYDIELAHHSKKIISSTNLLFCDSANITLGSIIANIKLWSRQYDLKYVVIDYLQLINMPNEKENNNFNQYQKIGMISRCLKVLSLKLNICIVALAQLNRKSEDRKTNDKSPILSDLRESGSIEQDADIVIFLYPDQSVNQLEIENDNSNIVILKIGKNRHGQTGSVNYLFKKDIGIFEAISDFVE